MNLYDENKNRALTAPATFAVILLRCPCTHYYILFLLSGLLRWLLGYEAAQSESAAAAGYGGGGGGEQAVKK